MTPAELHEKYTELELTDSGGYTVFLYIHRRCRCLVDNPDTHEKVCFDPPVQLDHETFDANRQQFLNYQSGEKYS